jgi:hypothetical protein
MKTASGGHPLRSIASQVESAAARVEVTMPTARGHGGSARCARREPPGRLEPRFNRANLSQSAPWPASRTVSTFNWNSPRAS